MNTLMLVALAVVALCYCGGKYCPKVLSSNKEMLLGVLVGVALCSFADLRMEGFDASAWNSNDCCNNSNSPKCKGLITEVNNSGGIVSASRIISDNCPTSPIMNKLPAPTDTSDNSSDGK
jgi:hypothetical protein